MTLTDDEFTVLMIAAEGQSMMPIGRWQVSVESLSARGLLAGPDKFNQMITPAGREALKERDKEDDADYRQILELGSKVANGHQQYQQFIEQAAQALANAIKIATTVTGDSPVAAWDRTIVLTKQRLQTFLADEEPRKVGKSPFLAAPYGKQK